VSSWNLVRLCSPCAEGGEVSGHSRWENVRRRVQDPGLSDAGHKQLIDYTEGYILAMEDVLKDIHLMWDEEDRDNDWYNAAHSISNRVEESLDNAKKTLDILNQ
jgi:hypothetical protein